MLEYWENGQKIECCAIYEDGKVGQVVILDDVDFGENPDLTEYPLARYPQPCAFTIKEKVEGQDGYYTLLDAEGNSVIIHDLYSGASEWNLYDANEWLTWQREHTKEKLARKERKIRLLEAHLALLKDILIKQGFRVITQEQASSLGIA